MHRSDARGLFAVTLAAAVALAPPGCRGGSEDGPTRSEYVARINAVCRPYARRLDKVPPPLSFTNLAEVARSVGRALPLLEEQAEKAKAVQPPPADEELVEEFFARTEASVRALRSVRRAARAGNAAAAQRSFLSFFRAREQARALADELGFRC